MSMVQQAKLFIVEHVHLAKDALHIYVALAVFLGACLLFGWKARQWKPSLLVLFTALVGEVWDIRDSLDSNDPIYPLENWKDIWNTMLLPTVLMLAARFTSVFEKREAPSGDETEMAAGPTSGEDDVG